MSLTTQADDTKTSTFGYVATIVKDKEYGYCVQVKSGGRLRGTGKHDRAFVLLETASSVIIFGPGSTGLQILRET